MTKEELLNELVTNIEKDDLVDYYLQINIKTNKGYKLSLDTRKLSGISKNRLLQEVIIRIRDRDLIKD